MDSHSVSCNNIVAFNQQTYKNNINSNHFTQEWEDGTWKRIARSRMPVLSQGSFLVGDRTFCMCMWESRWSLFTLEESEMQGLPILKLTAPFGSNHQMCHGKTATSWRKGRQDFASINIFLQGWQRMSFWLGLCIRSGSAQQVCRLFCNKKINGTQLQYVIQSVMRSTIDKRKEEFYLCHLPQIGSSGN